MVCFFFFFNDTAPTETHPLPLPAALPIYLCGRAACPPSPSMSTSIESVAAMIGPERIAKEPTGIPGPIMAARSEEHTSELQSHLNLVCRLLLEKKKTHSQSTSIAPPCYVALLLAAIAAANGLFFFFF